MTLFFAKIQIIFELLTIADIQKTNQKLKKMKRLLEFIFRPFIIIADMFREECDGVADDIVIIREYSLNTPLCEEYLQEIEENEKCAVAYNKCTDDDKLMAIASASATAQRENIDNSITDKEVKENIRAVNRAILIPLMAATGWLYRVNSWFRSLLLNIRVGGARTSQHLTGEAVDIVCTEPSGARISVITMARKAVELALPFDQMILYGTFLHLSYRRSGNNRGQVFIIHLIQAQDYENNNLYTYRTRFAPFGLQNNQADRTQCRNHNRERSS